MKYLLSLLVCLTLGLITKEAAAQQEVIADVNGSCAEVVLFSASDDLSDDGSHLIYREGTRIESTITSEIHSAIQALLITQFQIAYFEVVRAPPNFA